MLADRPPMGVFVGLTTLDLLQVVDEPVAPNVKLQATECLLAAGGPAANAAVAFGALGGKAQLLSSLGGGPLAAVARNDLYVHGVEVIDWSADATTDKLPLSSAAVYSRTGERCVISMNAEDQGGFTGTPEASKSAKVVLVDGHYAGRSLEVIDGLLMGVPIIMDAGSWKVPAEPLLHRAAAVVCSANFQPPGTNCEDVTRYLVDLGVRFAAVSRGDSDVTWRTADDMGTVRPPKVRVVDTLGAGDVLHGAFAYFVARQLAGDYDVPLSAWVESLESAIAVASFSCQFSGTRAWISEISKRSTVGTSRTW